jgi:apolipoprotein N-acyltransferase
MLRKVLSLLLIGIAFSFSFSPFDLWFIAFIAVTLLFITIFQAKSKSDAFSFGFAFGLGFYLVGANWMANPFYDLVDYADFVFLIGACLVIPAYCAIFVGCAALITWIISRDLSYFNKIITFACCWFLYEWILGHYFTTYPWQLIGYIWHDSLPILQITSIIGVYGLSFITVIIATLPAIFFIDKEKSFFKKKLVLVTAVTLIFAIIYISGYIRIINAGDTKFTNIMVRLINPNSIAKSKSKEDRQANLLKRIELSKLKPLDNIDILIWPETSLKFPVSNIYERRLKEFDFILRNNLPKDLYFIAGTILANLPSKDAKKADTMWNGVVFFKNGNLITKYKQNHLVPYSMYTPSLVKLLFTLPNMLESLEDLELDDRLDFTSSLKNETIYIDNLPPIAPLICYEITFSGDIIDKNNRPKWMVNIASDYYFKGTREIPQIFAIARFRTIEEGLPLMRISEDGKSGVIDSYGRILVSWYSEKEPNKIVDSYIPKEADGLTLFARYGYLFTWMIFTLFCLNIFREVIKLRLKRK